jgi:hypothetical protein
VSNADNLAANSLKKEAAMIRKKILNPDRIRGIKGGFSFIPHRFITDGFLSSLNPKQLLLYLFLVLVSDRYGLSYYSYDSICSLLQLTLDDYIQARDGLLKKDLIAFDGTLFQVLQLPAKPQAPRTSKPDGRQAVEKLASQLFKEV